MDLGWPGALSGGPGNDLHVPLDMLLHLLTRDGGSFQLFPFCGSPAPSGRWSATVDAVEHRGGQLV